MEWYYWEISMFWIDQGCNVNFLSDKKVLDCMKRKFAVSRWGLETLKFFNIVKQVSSVFRNFELSCKNANTFSSADLRRSEKSYQIAIRTHIVKHNADFRTAERLTLLLLSPFLYYASVDKKAPVSFLFSKSLHFDFLSDFFSALDDF
jgi:hypothetical protein